MATATNKQRVLNQIFTVLKKRYECTEPETLPVLEQFLYAICREGTTRESADRAYRILRERFYDWNEIRVSSIREVEEALSDLPDAELRAQRVIAFLQEVFETTFSFDLETLHKKGVKQAAKHLARYQAASPFCVAWVTQHSLGGHAIAVDGLALRVLRRLGVLDGAQEDPEAQQASLEHLIPKIRGPIFNELVSALADECCFEDEPSCGNCPLSHDCTSGQEALAGQLAGSRGGRTKPR